jgi:hypothetical protein
MPQHHRVAPTSDATIFVERLIRILIINVIIVVAASVIGLMAASFHNFGPPTIHFENEQPPSTDAEEFVSSDSDSSIDDDTTFDDDDAGEGSLDSVPAALAALRSGTRTPGKVADYLTSIEVDDSQRGAVSSALANYLADHDLDSVTEQKFLLVIETWNSPQAAPGLIRALDRVDSSTKVQILPILAGTDTRAAADKICTYLGQGTLGVVAADSLRIMGPTALPALQSYVDSPVLAKRTQARQLVSELGGAVDASELDTRLAQLNDPSWATRRRAIVWLNVVSIASDRRSEVIEALQYALDSATYSDRPHLERALARWGGNVNSPAQVAADPAAGKVTIETLVERGDDASLAALAAMLGGAERDEASTALVGFGNRAKPHVLAYFNDSNPFTRQKARALLATLNTPPAEASAQSIRDLASRDAAKVRSAADWLSTAAVDPSLQTLAAGQLQARLEGGEIGSDDDGGIDSGTTSSVDLPVKKALARWATPAQWRELMAMLDEPYAELVTPAVTKLASIDDPAINSQLRPMLVPKLAELLLSPTLQNSVHAGMVAAGAEGEEVAQGLVNTAFDPIVVFAATDVLRQVGTEKSLDILDQLDNYSRINRAAEMRKAALAAKDEIRKRMKAAGQSTPVDPAP